MSDPLPFRSARLAHHERLRTGRIRVTGLEAVLVAIVVVAIVAMAVWFLFFSSGGIGPGTV